MSSRSKLKTKLAKNHPSSAKLDSGSGRSFSKANESRTKSNTLLKRPPVLRERSNSDKHLTVGLPLESYSNSKEDGRPQCVNHGGHASNSGIGTAVDLELNCNAKIQDNSDITPKTESGNEQKISDYCDAGFKKKEIPMSRLCEMQNVCPADKDKISATSESEQNQARPSVSNDHLHAHGKEVKSDSDEEKDSDLSGLGLLSQDNFLDSSQDGDYYCEVRWACRSPETIKRLKKLRGQYSVDSVKKIVANFSDAYVKPKPPSHSYGLFLPTKDAIAALECKRQKAKERAAKRRPKRFQSREAVQEMINMLQALASKQRGEKEPSKSSSETSTNDKSSGSCDKTVAETSAKSSSGSDKDEDNCWSDEDLFQDNSFLIEATQNPEKFLNTSHDLAAVARKSGDHFSLSQQAVPSQAVHSQTKGINSSTSLFDDSGVIASSCDPKQPKTLCKSLNPATSTKIHGSMSISASNSKPFHKPFTFKKAPLPTSMGLNGSARPTTNLVNGSKNFQGGSSSVRPVNGHLNPSSVYKTSQSSTVYRSSGSSLCKTSNTFGAKSGCAYNSKFTASVNKFANGNSQINNAKPPPSTALKTSFRKFSSFQAENHVKSSTHRPEFGQNSSFKRTQSFDSLSSPNRGTVSTANTRTHSVTSVDFAKLNGTSVISKSKSVHLGNRPAFGTSDPCQNHFLSTGQQQQRSWNSTTHSKQTGADLNFKHDSNNGTGKDHAATSVQNDGFDVSLPEDVLQQLLEPDEILDSQADIISSASKKATNKQLSTTNSHAISCTKGQSSLAFPEHSSRNLCSNIPTDKKKDTCELDSLSCPLQQLQKGTDTFLSPVKPVMDTHNLPWHGNSSATHTFYKKTFSLQKMGSPLPLRALKHRQSSGPSSSTPVKHAKNDEQTEVTSTEGTSNKHGCSDSFLESAFDDSFMNDAALFESQILPILEKAETEALGATESKVVSPCSPVRCSPEEIEQKRQAAIQRRSLRLCQMKKTNGI